MPLITWCLIVVKFIHFTRCSDLSLYCHTHKTPHVICACWPLKTSSFSTQKDWHFLHKYLKAVWLNKYASFAECSRRTGKKKKKTIKLYPMDKYPLLHFSWKYPDVLPQIHPGKTNIFAHCDLNILILSSCVSLWKPSLDHFQSHSNHFVFSGK